MKRRWILRSFFTASLALCIAGWAWGYFYHAEVAYRSGGPSLQAEIIDGYLWICSAERGMGNEGFGCFNQPVTPEYLAPVASYIREKPGMHYCLGFFAREYEYTAYGWERDVGTPFWFLTTVSGAAVIYAWWKTRQKVNPATAFPVETGRMVI